MGVDRIGGTGAASANAVVATSTAGRLTPATPTFKEMMGGSTAMLMRGAEAAVRSLPMSPMIAASIRPGASMTMRPGYPGIAAPSVGAGASAEGPGATGAGTGSVGGGVEAALAQSQELNLYYLELQERVAAENRSFTTLSNVLKAKHDTVKNAIGNIR